MSTPVTRNHRNHPKRIRAEYMRAYRARHKALPEVSTEDDLETDDRAWAAILEIRSHMDDLRDLLLCLRSDVHGFTAAIADLDRRCNKPDRRYKALKDKLSKAVSGGVV
jgi:hypothetical protein